MNISAETLMMALKSVQRDMTRVEKLIRQKDLSEEDIDYYSELLLDLTRASCDLGSAYEEQRSTMPELPPLADLMNARDANLE
jgi:hypothetical protein